MKTSVLQNQKTFITSNTIKSKQQQQHQQQQIDEPFNNINSSTSETKHIFNDKGNQSLQATREEKDSFNFDAEKKDAIPMLIIDVNVRPGVKKNIYVYDGDTSEALAVRFSKEHSKIDI